MTIKQAKNIYCLGIGGIGISGLARIFHAMGKTVAGQDIKQSEITDELQRLGIKVLIGANIVANNFDLVIYSPAVPEADLAKISLPKLSHGEAIGQLMVDYYGIGVTGTNGKSTTSAMLGLILDQAGVDPSVLIGSQLSPKNETEKFKANARLGHGKYFVAESDEYRAKMLENKPQMIVLTNIAEDHLDYYKSLAEIKEAFTKYIKSLPADGILIFNADDHNTVEVCKHAMCHKYTFGIHHYADLQALNVKTENGIQTFDLHLNDTLIGKINLHVPAHYNVSNALAATLAALKLGVKIETIEKTLNDYAGIWRRFEIVGKLSGKPVISDYAHHPDAVAATIQAAKEFYPGKRVLVVFQPHHRNRTKSLFGEFVESLIMADELILPEIFDVAGREHGEEISSKGLADEVATKGTKVTFAENLDQAERLIKDKIKDFDAVLLMGAGDIDLLARKLIE